MSKNKPTIEFKELYTPVGVEWGRHVFPGFGEVDLTQMTEEQADDMIARGFKWLKKNLNKTLTVRNNPPAPED